MNTVKWQPKMIPHWLLLWKVIITFQVQYDNVIREMKTQNPTKNYQFNNTAQLKSLSAHQLPGQLYDTGL